AHRDLRDYYGRHGMAGSIGGRIGEEVSLDLLVGSERWGRVEARDPITLNRAREPWRPNPFMHTGVVDLTTLRLRIDTRERVKAPWTGGWYVQGEIESGRGDLIGPPPPWPTIAGQDGARLSPLIAPQPVPTRFQRAFLDARRRTRLSPGTELSVRLVAGGWIGGDALPTQRRLSIGGPGAVEGYDFRRVPTGETDVFTCGGRELDLDRLRAPRASAPHQEERDQRDARHPADPAHAQKRRPTRSRRFIGSSPDETAFAA
ncbi:MAG: hypothetical protein ACKORK_14360, partial [Gemmatimonadota bacterium]